MLALCRQPDGAKKPEEDEGQHRRLQEEQVRCAVQPHGGGREMVSASPTTEVVFGAAHTFDASLRILSLCAQHNLNPIRNHTRTPPHQ